MRPVTRKALKCLLIAVTLGIALAFVARSRRGAPGESPAVSGVDDAPAPERGPVPVPVATPAPVPVPAPVPARVPAPVVVESVPAPTAPTPPTGTAVPTASPVPAASDIVEIDPDRLPSVAEAGPELVRSVRTRRPQLVVGGVALAFVVAAAAIGTMAYDSIAGDDGDDAVPAAATGSPVSTQRPSDGPNASSGPLEPQKFAALGARSGGSLNHVTLPGRRSGVTADVWVWLPPQYQRDDFRTKRFPVLVVHSAYPGSGENTMLEGKAGLLAKLAEGIAAGTLPPFVVVAPELTPYEQTELSSLPNPESIDTECSDIPGRPKMATFHNEDVREAVAATYRVATDRHSWGLLGEGTGGLCAAKYALQYPQYYAAAASLSGRTTLKSPLWPAPGVREGQEPTTLLGPRPDVRLFLSNATAETAGRQASTALKNAAKAPTVIDTATASGDSAKQLPAALAFLDRNLTDSAAGASGGGPSSTVTSTRRPGA